MPSDAEDGAPTTSMSLTSLPVEADAAKQSWTGSGEFTLPFRSHRRDRRSTPPLHSPAHTLRARSNSPASEVSSSPRAFTNISSSTQKGFSEDEYRGLHHRNFHSINEELGFLRQDFVSSRRTLALMQKELSRLQKELKSFSAEAATWREKVERYEHAMRQCGVNDVQELLDSDVDLRAANKRGKARMAGDVTEGVAIFTAAKSTPPARSDGGGVDAHTAQLISDLRLNLARRDTTLHEMQVELQAMGTSRDVLERDLARCREELRATSAERTSIQAQLDSKSSDCEELRAGMEVASRKAQSAEEVLKTTQAKLRALELMSGMDGQGQPRLTGQEDAAGEVRYLQQQMQHYRNKWRESEAEVDGLRATITKLQNNATQASAMDSITAVEEKAKAALTGVQQRRFEEELRAQHEELLRLQRRLERESESASFREDQLRQKHMEESRHQQVEVNALKEQLRAAKSQSAKEESDREALIQQLRQTRQSESLSGALQTQNDALKQRCAELAADLSQYSGREKELQVSVQRELAERVRLERQCEELQTSLSQAKKNQNLLQEEVGMLKNRVGVAEGRTFTLEQMLSQQAAIRQLPRKHSDHGDEGGEEEARPATSSTHTRWAEKDPQVLMSELKGYSALMQLNMDLHSKLDEAQRQLHVATESLRRTQPDRADGGDGTVPSSAVRAQRDDVLAELGSLRVELARAKDVQSNLLRSWQDAQRETALIVADNTTLANGIDIIQRQLHTLRKEKKCTTPSRHSILREKINSAKDFAATRSPRDHYRSSSSARRTSHSVLQRELHASQDRVRVLERSLAQSRRDLQQCDDVLLRLDKTGVFGGWAPEVVVEVVTHAEPTTNYS